MGWLGHLNNPKETNMSKKKSEKKTTRKAKQTPQERVRSQAAKKAWATRRANAQ